MHIILFGGTFDPPHLAHTQMVQQLLDQQLADEVWYVPVGSQHTKHFTDKKMTAIEHRLAMLKLILVPRTKVETFEVTSGKPSHTDLTLRSLRAQHPQHTFSWLIGSDQLAKLHLWIQEDGSPTFPSILKEFDFYVYPRAGYPMALPHPQLKAVEGVAPMPDSSTEIRRRIKAGESITGLVDSQVEEYIIDKKLYQS
ncbi:MAG TPA: nicotinate (nicotinamide) nucleotide adenylyltransferase [Patescibacteria group bacterium]